MRSRWIDQVGAILWKEALSEMRGRHGLFTAGMFSFLIVVVLVFASVGSKPTGATVAAMLTAALVFSAVVTIPRTLISEDEQGTFSMLVLLADPGAAFFGKVVANAAQMLVGALVLSGVYLAMTEVSVVAPGTLLGGLLLLALALAVGVSFCGALVLGSSNRWLLAGVVSLPLLVPVVFLGVVALRSGVDGSSATLANQSLVALAGYCLTLTAAGPSLIAKVWGNG